MKQGVEPSVTPGAGEPVGKRVVLHIDVAVGRQRDAGDERGRAVEKVPPFEQEDVVIVVLLESGLHTSIVVVPPEVTSSIIVGPT